MSRAPERARYDLIAERVSEILYHVWDPIGVSGVPQARDEYDSYVPLVVQMLMEGKKKEEIARHLHRIEGETMGLSPGSRPSEQTEAAADTLLDHFEWLEERANQAPDPTRFARGSS